MLEWSNNTVAKPKQLLELQRWCLYEPVGAGNKTRYHILKVYDEPTTDQQLYYPYGDIYANHPQVLIPQHLLKYGVNIIYKIQYGIQVYIGSTFDIRTRLSNHFNGYANDMTYSMLKRGATFELLEVVSNEDDLRQREKEYIQEYCATGMFIVINDRHNNSKNE